MGNPLRVDELIAVSKTIDYDEHTGQKCGNRIELLSTRHLTEQIIAQSTNTGAGTTVVQKFVRCNGPYSFICRAVWRRYKPPHTWIITNKVQSKDETSGLIYQDRYVTRMKNNLSCSLVNSAGEDKYSQIVKYAFDIAHFVERHTNIKLTELAADFIRDPAGIWWFLGVKAFQTEQTTARVTLGAFLSNWV